jgi:hypothetical protein
MRLLVINPVILHGVLFLELPDAAMSDHFISNRQVLYQKRTFFIEASPKPQEDIIWQAFCSQS